MQIIQIDKMRSQKENKIPEKIGTMNEHAKEFETPWKVFTPLKYGGV